MLVWLEGTYLSGRPKNVRLRSLIPILVCTYMYLLRFSIDIGPKLSADVVKSIIKLECIITYLGLVMD